MEATTATPLPRRLDATGADLDRGRSAARQIAATVLRRDPGPLTTAPSMSHYVYLGTDIVVKLVDATGHNRLDREITLAGALPPGLGAPLLTSGSIRLTDCDVRYACFTRVAGKALIPGLPGVEATTARLWAGQAVRMLTALHDWKPGGDVARTLRESPVHEGFASRAAFVADIDRLAADVPSHLIDGLRAIADRAPQHLRPDVPVHADGDWGNWLAAEHGVTALLDSNAPASASRPTTGSCSPSPAVRTSASSSTSSRPRRTPTRKPCGRRANCATPPAWLRRANRGPANWSSSSRAAGGGGRSLPLSGLARTGRKADRRDRFALGKIAHWAVLVQSG